MRANHAMFQCLNSKSLNSRHLFPQNAYLFLLLAICTCLDWTFLVLDQLAGSLVSKYFTLPNVYHGFSKFETVNGELGEERMLRRQVLEEQWDHGWKNLEDMKIPRPIIQHHKRKQHKHPLHPELLNTIILTAGLHRESIDEVPTSCKFPALFLENLMWTSAKLDLGQVQWRN